MSLTAKLLLRSSLRRGQIGTLIIHASMIVLLLGGLVTYLNREEGYLELAPGETTATISDYHTREFAVVKNGQTIVTIPAESLREKFSVQNPDLPFRIAIRSYCRNCTVIPVKNAPTTRRGDAARLELKDAPLLAQNEDNQAGIEFTIGGVSKADGVYIAFAGLAAPTSLKIGQDEYFFLMRPITRTLPFAVHLRTFKKTTHPGTDLARDYQADVTVKDGAAQWDANIAMNEPLRHRGYTLYQSSVATQGDRVTTIITVVRDSGQIFPYLALALLALGMGIHLAQGVRRKRAAP